MRAIVLTLSIGLVTASSVWAEEFVVPNAFVANTPAVASEVNANFDAIAAAINGLAARVDALEAPSASSDCALGRLEGYYRIISLESELGAVYSGGWNVDGMSTRHEGICFRADHTYEGEGISHTDVTRGTGGYGVTPQWYNDSDPVGERFVGTYTLTPDCTLTANYVEDGTVGSAVFHGDATADLFIGTSTENEYLENDGVPVGDSWYTSLMLLIRQPASADPTCGLD